MERDGCVPGFISKHPILWREGGRMQEGMEGGREGEREGGRKEWRVGGRKEGDMIN